MALDIDELISEAYETVLLHADDQSHEDAGPSNVDGSRVPARNRGDGDIGGNDEGERKREEQDEDYENGGDGELVDNVGFTINEVCDALVKGTLMEIDWSYCEKVSTSCSNGVWDCGKILYGREVAGNCIGVNNWDLARIRGGF